MIYRILGSSIIAAILCVVTGCGSSASESGEFNPKIKEDTKDKILQPKIPSGGGGGADKGKPSGPKPNPE